jgi:hypothetical protein
MSIKSMPPVRESPPHSHPAVRRTGELDRHRPSTPDTHRCTCGRLRHVCVRELVRKLWPADAAHAPGDRIATPPVSPGRS